MVQAGSKGDVQRAVQAGSEGTIHHPGRRRSGPSAKAPSRQATVQDGDDVVAAMTAERVMEDR
jgi:hypothetical protein